MKMKIICLALSTMLLCLGLQVVSARVQFGNYSVITDTSGTTVTYELSNTPVGKVPPWWQLW